MPVSDRSVLTAVVLTVPMMSSAGALSSVTLPITVPLSGVQAAADGGFTQVIGVDRGAGATALTDAGATLVITDLQELVP